MDSSNAPQLTDTEAEAALLALGPKLEWGDGFSKGPWCILAKGTDCVYMLTRLWMSFRRYEVQQITKAGAQKKNIAIKRSPSQKPPANATTPPGNGTEYQPMKTNPKLPAPVRFAMTLAGFVVIFVAIAFAFQTGELRRTRQERDRLKYELRATKTDVEIISKAYAQRSKELLATRQSQKRFSADTVGGSKN